MNGPDERDREIADLRERLARLSEAGLRITEDLDFNTVLQGVLDSARSLPARSTRREQQGEEDERLRILAVDDDPNDLRYVRDTLAKSGYDPILTGEPTMWSGW